MIDREWCKRQPITASMINNEIDVHKCEGLEPEIVRILSNVKDNPTELNANGIPKEYYREVFEALKGLRSIGYER